jgi:hypothetical protein
MYCVYSEVKSSFFIVFLRLLSQILINYNVSLKS